MDALRHRGPDADGLFEDGRIVLGHRRLAVLDLETGDQPMASEDGELVVVFNGEVFNHHALRAELQGRARFRTRSDTEVLLHAYRERGEGFVADLRGFFALALWDAHSGRLLLARDRVGQKPLFFSEHEGLLVFASEVRALLAGLGRLGAEPRVDPAAVAEALALRYTDGRRTAYRGIERVLPGERIVFESGHRRTARIAHPPAISGAETEVDEEAALEEFGARFDEAVRLRLEADVPLGLLLSGGLDSTAVLESAARQGTGALRTFTVAFSRSSESEGAAARATAEHFGTRHREIPLSEAHLVDRAAQVLSSLDEPFADPSLLPTRLVCEAAREEVTVALTGDGGDELLGGYRRYLRALAWAAGERGQVPSATKRISRRLRLIGSGLPRSFEAQPRSAAEVFVFESVKTPAPLRAFLAGPLLQDLPEDEAPEARIARELREAGGEDPASLLAAMLLFDQRHDLPGEMLVKVDRASMAASLEVRSPLLDHELIAFASTLPVSLKVAGGRGKVLLRHHLAGRVPEALLDLPKKGFGTPLGRWFRGALAPLASELLGASRLAADGYLDARALDRIRRAHVSRRRNFGELLWTLCALESWYRTTPG